MSNINNIKKIFLVDDEYDLAMLFKLGLELEGFIVDMFVDPLTALSFFKNDYSSYDLALLDIKMPNLNGYELCNEMVKIHNKIKICFITAFDVQKEDLQTIPVDPNSILVLHKPISIKFMVQRLKEQKDSIR
ncbi:MAG TPA: response regulator [Candidatus Nitrosocosmicus sp.]